jgi:hypothetical protein
MAPLRMLLHGDIERLAPLSADTQTQPVPLHRTLYFHANGNWKYSLNEKHAVLVGNVLHSNLTLISYSPSFWGETIRTVSHHSKDILLHIMRQFFDQSVHDTTVSCTSLRYSGYQRQFFYQSVHATTVSCTNCSRYSGYQRQFLGQPGHGPRSRGSTPHCIFSCHSHILVLASVTHFCTFSKKWQMTIPKAKGGWWNIFHNCHRAEAQLQINIYIYIYIYIYILSRIPGLCVVVWLIILRGFGLDTGFIHYGDYSCTERRRASCDVRNRFLKPRILHITNLIPKAKGTKLYQCQLRTALWGGM